MSVEVASGPTIEKVEINSSADIVFMELQVIVVVSTRDKTKQNETNISCGGLLLFLHAVKRHIMKTIRLHNNLTYTPAGYPA
jgi:hypothetical protein